MNCMSFDSEHFPSVDRFELELICYGDYVSVYVKRLLWLMTHLAVTPATGSGSVTALLDLGFFCLGFLRFFMPQLSRKLLMLPGFGGMFFRCRWYVFLGPPNPFVVWTLEAKSFGALGKGDVTLHRCSGHQSWHKLGGLKQDVWDLAKHPFHLGSFPQFFRWKNRLETNFPHPGISSFFKWRFKLHRIPY